MRLDQDLADAAFFATPDRFAQLREHIDPAWIEEALTWAGTTSVRRRRLPAEQVVWLVIAMALFRAEPIERVVDFLDLAQPDKLDTLVAKSGICQARQRLKEDPLEYLFTVTAAEWATRSAQANTWRGLCVYGMDGTTMRVADSHENRKAFKKPRGRNGEGAYPQVRAVAVFALRSHLLSAFRIASFAVGETTLAREVWQELPTNALVIVDRVFLVKEDLIHLELSGNRHWLTRTKSNTKYTKTKKLGRNDYLAEIEVNVPGLPKKWTVRVIHYKRKGYEPSTLITSLLDADTYPALELVSLYHERWEAELAFDEVKTHLLDRQETIRSRTPEGVRQELWGIAIAYNLVRLEMERVAKKAQLAPTRLSFVHSLALIREELGRLVGPRLAPGTIPRRLIDLERNLKRLILPERRTERVFPRAVKIKTSGYPVKRSAKKRRNTAKSLHRR